LKIDISISVRDLQVIWEFCHPYKYIYETQIFITLAWNNNFLSSLNASVGYVYKFWLTPACQRINPFIHGLVTIKIVEKDINSKTGLIYFSHFPTFYLYRARHNGLALLGSFWLIKEKIGKSIKNEKICQISTASHFSIFSTIFFMRISKSPKTE
jgi:hypothetical protein